MSRDLVERARRGDQGAFQTLAIAHGRRLYGTATLILRDADAASDAVQDALIEAWRDLPTLHDPDTVDPWLLGRLVRACERADRRVRRVVTVRSLDIDGSLESTPVDGPPGRLGFERIEEAFGRLPVDQRAVLVLRHRLGLDDAGLAAVLGGSERAAAARRRRADGALAAALDRDERDLPSLQERPA